MFDGTCEIHDEDEPFSPISVYGASKAAGDAVVASWERHYIVRTSWVIGEAATSCAPWSTSPLEVSPAVVDDQIGRLTFLSKLTSTGFTMPNGAERLREHVATLDRGS